MSDLVLVIGSKRYSSWSLRPWLALKQTGTPFEELVVTLRQPDTKACILQHSPSGKVPLLKHGELIVWESLAICEYLAESWPESGLWPQDRAARAVARSVSTEMHAGFMALRQHLPMDVCALTPMGSLAPEVAADVERIQRIWRDCRSRFGGEGPFLFGRFSIADAMYAPVATRFTTYGVELDTVSRAYVQAIWALPAMQEWKAAAEREAA